MVIGSYWEYCPIKKGDHIRPTFTCRADQDMNSEENQLRRLIIDHQEAPLWCMNLYSFYGRTLRIWTWFDLSCTCTGLKKEDIHVEVVEEDRTLHIRVGHPIKEQEAKQAPPHAASSSSSEQHVASGSSLRLDKKLRLPENADMDAIRAEILESGMLTITVPKQKMKAPVTRNVEVTAASATSHPQSTQATPATADQNNNIGAKSAAVASEEPSTSTSQAQAATPPKQ